MLIRAVTAVAFGPLAGERLAFADGMTVVYGPNESAKSSWHAAIYAALCGRRRGRVPSTEERRFAELHRPWDGPRDDWAVGAEVLLDDGRRLEVRQDLAGKVDCEVRDLDLGRDCSAEFLAEGTPDVTRWLGLDRRSFPATAHVSQAQLLQVHDHAGGLREQLQRAAASTSGEHTAASALERIEAFRRSHVGTDRAPTKPLRRAHDAVRQARSALDAARGAHAAYVAHLVEVERLRALAASAARDLRRHEAAGLARAARVARATADEASALHERLGGVEPAASAAGEETARIVAVALAAWDARPAAARSIPARRWSLLRGLAPAVPRAATGPADASSAITASAITALAVAVVAVAVAASLLSDGPDGTAGLIGTAAVAAVVVVAGIAALVVARRRRDREWHALWLAESDQARRRATELVMAAAQRCEVAASSAEQAVASLREWQRDRATQAGTLDWARGEWSRLVSLLAGGSLAELHRAAAAAHTRARQAGAGFAAAELAAAESTSAESTADVALDGPAVEQVLERLRREAHTADLRAGEAEGTRRAMAAHLSGAGAGPGAGAEAVGPAEEQLARAETELVRIRSLDETLTLTCGFLEAAQERAHRTIAPVLADTVRRWLPDVTAGRYTEVAVDPENLRVRVRGPSGRWRAAELLSHGTAEQVYLLLRIALARHLVRPGTTCPLLLDDVTVHADAGRTTQILELLVRASDERQIILFTQQERVREWAHTRLAGPRHVVRELGTIAVG